MRLALDWSLVVAIEEMDHQLTHVCLMGGHRIHVHESYDAVIAKWDKATADVKKSLPAPSVAPVDRAESIPSSTRD